MLTKTGLSYALVAAIGFVSAAVNAEGGDQHHELLKVLPAATVTLQQGLTAASAQGTPLSAKFEIDEGHLQLSVYTAKGSVYSEVVVDHVTGKIAKSAAISEAEDMMAAKSQFAAVAKGTKPLTTAIDKAEQTLAGYRAVSVVARNWQKHSVAVVELVKGKNFKLMTESLE